MNYVRTALLLAAMTGLFLAVGYMLGGEAGMIVALALALGMNVFAYWNSDKPVLRMYGAREVTKAIAHLFIVNPLHGGSVDSLFSTHPATANRIRRLREMAGVAGPWG